jgi:hypothetical protein
MRALALALLVAGCGGGANDTPAVVDAGPPDLAGVYPPGPYGYLVGDTLADFTAQGYRLSPYATDSSKLPFEDIRLSEVRAAAPSCRCLFFDIAAAWCKPCQMARLSLSRLGMQGGRYCLLQTLAQGTVPGPPPGMDATRADLDAWTAGSAEDFPVVMPNETARQLLGTTAAFPTTVTIDTTTMKILAVSMGNDGVAALMASCP